MSQHSISEHYLSLWDHCLVQHCPIELSVMKAAIESEKVSVSCSVVVSNSLWPQQLGLCTFTAEGMKVLVRQSPLSMRFPRQEYWSGLPFPSSGDLFNPGIEPKSPELQANSLLSEPPPGEAHYPHAVMEHLKYC